MSYIFEPLESLHRNKRFCCIFIEGDTLAKWMLSITLFKLLWDHGLPRLARDNLRHSNSCINHGNLCFVVIDDNDNLRTFTNLYTFDWMIQIQIEKLIWTVYCFLWSFIRPGCAGKNRVIYLQLWVLSYPDESIEHFPVL